MSDLPIASPFAGAAPYYKFRAPYAPGALDYVRAVFALNSSSRVLDLGCGPGKIAIPLSAMVGEVVAADPDEDMLGEGRRQAGEAGRQNIRWLHGRAEEILPSLGAFHAVTMGQSFHWMQRDLVLRQLGGMVGAGGGLALISPSLRRPQESWEARAREVAARYPGTYVRHPRANPDEPENSPALLRSAHFSQLDSRVFEMEIERDMHSILGCLYSMSWCAKPLFGDDAPAFERELTAALLRENPSGIFRELVDTEVVIARWAPR
jgi:SAM-dependent methyltransferase